MSKSAIFGLREGNGISSNNGREATSSELDARLRGHDVGDKSLRPAQIKLIRESSRVRLSHPIGVDVLRQQTT
jgi:hypothetical protein